MPGALIERLPNLKFMAITGRGHRTLDVAAATRRGIVVSRSSGRGEGRYSTPELAWGLVLCTARHISYEDRQMRSGGWQHTAGMVLYGKTLGLLGSAISAGAWPNMARPSAWRSLPGAKISRPRRRRPSA